MAHRCVSDAKEVNIEAPEGLVVWATTVEEVDGRLEKSCSDSAAKPQMKCGTDRLTEDYRKVKSG